MNRETQTQDNPQEDVFAALDDIGVGIARLKSQKAELLEALEAIEAKSKSPYIINPSSTVTAFQGTLSDIEGIARAAIKKARGD